MIDDDDKAIGIISLSDLLFYLVLRPCGELIFNLPTILDRVPRNNTLFLSRSLLVDFR